MSNILDDVLAATNGKARVVSENHDLRTIRTESVGSAATADPSATIRSQMDSLRSQIKGLESGGGGWDDAEYGRTRAQQIAEFQKALANAEKALAESDSPAGRARALKIIADAQQELVQRAINRAGLSQTANGEIQMVTDDEKSWWHRMGVLVSGAMDAAEARTMSRVNYPVGKRPYYEPIDNLGDAAEGLTTKPSERAFYIVREDTGARLADYAGPGYKVIQIDQMTDFLDGLVKEHGARYATMGAVDGGAHVWAQIYLPKQSFTLAGGDETQMFATFWNSHIPGEAGLCFGTGDRIVCGNTARVAIGKDGSKGIRFRHVGNVNSRLEEGRRALGITAKGMEKYAENADVLSRTTIPSATHYFNDVLDTAIKISKVTADQCKTGAEALAAALDVTDAQRELAEKSIARQIERRGGMLEHILEEYDSSRCGWRGTAYGGLNAVTGVANNDPEAFQRHKGSDKVRDERRFQSLLTGELDDLQQVAYEKALEYAR